jgi:hypothetical protein
MQQPKRMNRNMLNLAIDLGVFAAFLAATAPHFTGMAVHEWLGLALGAGLLTHLLLHWQWVAAVTRRFFGATAWSARLNYLLNTLLFVAFTAIIVTGLMISEAVLPLFGLAASQGGSFKQIHKLASDATLFLVGLHVALHWSWIVKMLGRVAGRLRGVRAPQAPSLGRPRQEV